MGGGNSSGGAWFGPADWSDTLTARSTAGLEAQPAVAIAPGEQQLVFGRALARPVGAWSTPASAGPGRWTAARSSTIRATTFRRPGRAEARRATAGVLAGDRQRLFQAWFAASAGRAGGLERAAAPPGNVLRALGGAHPGGQQLVFWQGTNNDLLEAWLHARRRLVRAGGLSAQLHGPGIVHSAPSVVLTPGGQQLVFWQGTGHDLFEAWSTPASAGPGRWTERQAAQSGQRPFGALSGSDPRRPAADLLAGDRQRPLRGLVPPRLGWSGPVDWSAQLHSTGNVLSAPSVVLTPGGQQLVFWQGTKRPLRGRFTGGFGWSARWIGALAGCPGRNRVLSGSSVYDVGDVQEWAQTQRRRFDHSPGYDGRERWPSGREAFQPTRGSDLLR